MIRSAAIQDYVKACYRLGKSTGELVNMSDLAKTLEVSPPSVTNMVKRMIGLKLVKKGRDGRVELTTRGTALALEVIRHHRLLETFLIDELGMNWGDAHEEAEVLEHYISERFEVLLDKRLAAPTHDPHGEPIPRMDGTLPKGSAQSLLDCAEKSSVVIKEVRSRDPEMLQYLQHRNLTPGTKIRIEEVAPFNGPIAIRVERETHHISREVASCIYT